VLTMHAEEIKKGIEDLRETIVVLATKGRPQPRRRSLSAVLWAHGQGGRGYFLGATHFMQRASRQRWTSKRQSRLFGCSRKR
jgi:hypothetical protein